MEKCRGGHIDFVDGIETGGFPGEHAQSAGGDTPRIGRLDTLGDEPARAAGRAGPLPHPEEKPPALSSLRSESRKLRSKLIRAFDGAPTALDSFAVALRDAVERLQVLANAAGEDLRATAESGSPVPSGPAPEFAACLDALERGDHHETGLLWGRRASHLLELEETRHGKRTPTARSVGLNEESDAGAEGTRRARFDALASLLIDLSHVQLAIGGDAAAEPIVRTLLQGVASEALKEEGALSRLVDLLAAMTPLPREIMLVLTEGGSRFEEVARFLDDLDAARNARGQVHAVLRERRSAASGPYQEAQQVAALYRKWASQPTPERILRLELKNVEVAIGRFRQELRGRREPTADVSRCMWALNDARHVRAGRTDYEVFLDDWDRWGVVRSEKDLRNDLQYRRPAYAAAREGRERGLSILASEADPPWKMPENGVRFFSHLGEFCRALAVEDDETRDGLTPTQLRDEARKLFERALNVQDPPSDRDVRFLAPRIGECLREAGRWSEAIEYYRRVRQQRSVPGHETKTLWESHYWIAECCRRLGIQAIRDGEAQAADPWFSEALEVLRAAPGLWGDGDPLTNRCTNPNNNIVHQALADLFVAWGRFSDAEVQARFQKACEPTGERARAKHQKSLDYTDYLLCRALYGQAHADESRIRDAVNHLEAFLARSVDRENPYHNLWPALALTHLLRKQQRHDDANEWSRFWIRHFATVEGSDAARIDTEWLLALEDVGAMRRLVSALEERIAKEGRRELESLEKGLGLFLAIQGRLAGSKGSADPVILTLRGRLYRRLGRFDDALGDFRRSQDASPRPRNVGIALLEQGKTHLAQGNLEKAASCFEGSYQAAAAPAALFLLAKTNWRRGHWDGAIEALCQYLGPGGRGEEKGRAQVLLAYCRWSRFRDPAAGNRPEDHDEALNLLEASLLGGLRDAREDRWPLAREAADLLASMLPAPRAAAVLGRIVEGTDSVEVLREISGALARRGDDREVSMAFPDCVADAALRRLSTNVGNPEVFRSLIRILARILVATYYRGPVDAYEGLLERVIGAIRSLPGALSEDGFFELLVGERDAPLSELITGYADLARSVFSPILGTEAEAGAAFGTGLLEKVNTFLRRSVPEEIRPVAYGGLDALDAVRAWQWLRTSLTEELERAPSALDDGTFVTSPESTVRSALRSAWCLEVSGLFRDVANFEQGPLREIASESARDGASWEGEVKLAEKEMVVLLRFAVPFAGDPEKGVDGTRRALEERLGSLGTSTVESSSERRDVQIALPFAPPIEEAALGSARQLVELLKSEAWRVLAGEALRSDFFREARTLFDAGNLGALDKRHDALLHRWMLDEHFSLSARWLLTTDARQNPRAVVHDIKALVRQLGDEGSTPGSLIRLRKRLRDFGAELRRSVVGVARQRWQERFELNAFLAEEASALREEYSAFPLDVEPGPQVAVEMDPILLHRALMNLLHNANHAVRYGTDGRIAVAVDLDEEDATAIVEVSNPFADEAGDADSRDGTGLGLRDAQAIIESAGGSLLRHVIPPSGAEPGRFTVRLNLPIPQEIGL